METHGQKWWAFGRTVWLMARAVRGLAIMAAVLAVALAASLAASLGSSVAVAGSYEWAKIDQDASGNALSRSNSSGEVWIELAGDRAPGSAFTFTSPAGISILFDPWRGPASGSWGLWFADDTDQLEIGTFNADAVLSAHPEMSRDANAQFDGTMADGTLLVDRFDGAWAMGDVRVIGFADNNIALIIMGGIRIVIWGEGVPAADTALWDEIGVVDLLLLPIDDTETSLSYAAAATIIDRLSPDVIVPGLYLAAGVDAAQDQLGSAEKWTRQQYYHTILREPRLSVTGEWVHGLDKHVQYFGNHHLLN